MVNRILSLVLIFGVFSPTYAYEVSFTDPNTAVIEVGDPVGQVRQAGYFQIFGNSYQDTYAPGGFSLSAMIYLSDANWTNWLDCYMDTQMDPQSAAAILALSTAVNTARGDSKIIIAKDPSGTCSVTMDSVPGNVHNFAYEGFYVDAYMSNFRVNLPVEFSAPFAGYYRYFDGIYRVVIFANASSGFHIDISGNTGVFQCQLSVGNAMHEFAVASFGGGGSTVAEYNISSNGDNNTCNSMGFRIGV